MDEIATEVIGITGATGFIGSHLVKLLSEKNITYIPFVGNLLSDTDVRTFFEENHITQIIHLAGTFNPSFTSLIEKNVYTTEKILAIGVPLGLRKIIYASTGAVYGDSTNEYAKESDVLNPNTLYGFSKMVAEDVIQVYAKKDNIEYIILRFPNIYGEGNLKGVIYNFLHEIKEKGSITIAGDGQQKRQFLNVDDACIALYKALLFHKTGIFNISHANVYTITDVAALLAKKYSFTVNHRKQDNFLKNLLLDTTNSHAILHFSSTLSLEDYLQSVI